MYGRPKYLDRERCFKLWMELGTIPRVQRRLAGEGLINPDTGEMFSEPGVRIAAWKWALYNPEEARQLLIERRGIYKDKDLRYWFERLEVLGKAFLTTKVDRYDEWKEQFDNYRMRILQQTSG